jgi:hypothetical protein
MKMTKDEIKNRLKEIDQEIEILQAKADKAEIFQMGLKIG